MFKKVLHIILLILWAAPLFAQSVDTAWVRRYNGPGSGDDDGEAIAIDDSGNIYVTGISWGSDTDYDYCTIKYYPNGEAAWVSRYNGPNDSTDSPYAIAVDKSGNVYVTGISIDRSSYNDIATIKYDSNGDTAWVRRYTSPGKKAEMGFGIAADGAGNVYVTGVISDSATGNDYGTIKYYPNGDTAWVRTYNGTTNEFDAAQAIAVDNSGNSYVTGVSYGTGTENDIATMRYDLNGNELWIRRYNGPGNRPDKGHAIVVDGWGNIYVAGESYGDTQTNLDYITIKYYPDGDTGWLRRYNGHGNGHDRAFATAIDDLGNLYVTGVNLGNGSYYDYVTIRYYPNGDTSWVRRYNGPGNLWDGACAMAIDSSFNVYVTGTSYGSGTSYDYATIKYDSSGNQFWVQRYNGTGNGYDEASGIATDGSGSVYVSGTSPGSGTGNDYVTIKYVQFLRGDVNRDYLVNIIDVVYLVNYILKSGFTPDPIPQVGDVNCDDLSDITDVIYLIHYLFKNGPAPCI